VTISVELIHDSGDHRIERRLFLRKNGPHVDVDHQTRHNHTHREEVKNHRPGYKEGAKLMKGHGESREHDERHHGIDKQGKELLTSVVDSLRRQ
jgi:hypothetical protein